MCYLTFSYQEEIIFEFNNSRKQLTQQYQLGQIRAQIIAS